MIDTLFEVNTFSETGATTMRLLQFLSAPRRLPWVYVLLAFALCAPAAHANTYLYSFTAAQFLNALSSDADYSEDGYYSILLQPTTLTGYSIAAENSPDPGDGAADWQATTDSANPFGSGTWLEFGKYTSQTAVTLVSGANGGTGSMFLGQTYSDSGVPAPPISFGATVATITNIMSSSALFSFALNDATNPGAVAFTGEAMAIWSSGSSALFNTGKTRVDIPFTLTLTGTQAAPEPGTWILFLAGAACMLAAITLKKKTPAASSRS